MADTRVIPGSIKDARVLAYYDLVDRLSTLDISPLLVYRIDSVDATALPHLAEQFNVMGDGGWDLCSTDDERRALIKKAILLHRQKGTPYAVKQAILALGFTNVSVLSRTPSYSEYIVVVAGKALAAGDADRLRGTIATFGRGSQTLNQLRYGQIDKWGDGRKWGQAGDVWSGYVVI